MISNFIFILANSEQVMKVYIAGTLRIKIIKLIGECFDP